MIDDLRAATMDFHKRLWKAIKFLPAGVDANTPAVIEMCRQNPGVARLMMTLLATALNGKINPNDYIPNFTKVPASAQQEVIVLGVLLICYLANHPGVEPPELTPLLDKYPVIPLCGGLVRNEMKI